MFNIDRFAWCVLFFFSSSIYCFSQSHGYHVEHYNSDDGLPQNSIKGVEMDSKGYIWLATEVGLVRYDGETFKLYNLTENRKPIRERVSSLYLLNRNDVCVILNDRDHYKVNKWQLLEKLTAKEISHSPVNGQNMIWVDSIYEYCRMKVATGEQPEWILPDIRLVSRSAVNSVVKNAGSFYYFNRDRELIETDTGRKHFRKVRLQGPIADQFRDKDRSSIPVSLMEYDSRFFIRWGEYIYSTKPSTDHSSLYGDTVLHVGEIANVTTFTEWKGQNLAIVGTMTDGFYTYRKLFFSTILLNDVEGNVFYAQAPFGKSSVLTKKGVLPEQPDLSLSGFTSESILKTGNGHYYFNRWKNREESGITELDNNLKELRYIRETDLLVHCMIQLKDSSIWVSARNRFIGKIVGDSIKWLALPPALKGFNVRIIQEISPGKLWIAGTTGLASIDLQTQEVKRITEMDGINIRAFHLDNKGVLWIGTYGSGYFGYYKGKLVQMPFDKKNFLVNVHSFLPDANGFCWMSTNQGLFQAKLEDMYAYIRNPTIPIYYHYYDRASGFLSNEFNGGCFPSGIRLGDNRFSLPSIQGIVQFDPAAVQPVFSSNGIHIDAIKADTLLIDPSTNNFNLPGKTKYVIFNVSSPFFGTSYNHNVLFQLKGSDSTWRRLPAQGLLVFSRLPKGDYELILRKQMGFGNQVIEKRVSFSIHPAFYETWFFRILVTLMLLTLLFLMFRLRILILLRQRKRLEEEIRERTSEQQSLIDSLESTVHELEHSREQISQHTFLQERLAMIITHDLQSPLRFLSDVSRRLNIMAGRYHLKDVTEMSSDIQRSSASIHHFVQDFGFWLKALSRDFRIQSRPVSLKELTRELDNFFPELLKLKGNRMEVISLTPVIVMSDRQLLLIILRNIIDNSNKYTENGKITIQIEAVKGKVSISVTDTGRGISADKRKKLSRLINDPHSSYYQDECSGGYGYRFMAVFSRLLHINMSISSEEGTGTSVVLSNLKQAEVD